MFETTLRYNSPNNKHAVEGELARFDSVIIDGKMLAHSSKAIPQLIYKLRNERSIQYYVEPVLSQFRKGNDFRYADGTLKSWHEKYVQEIGDPLKEHLRSETNADPRRMEEDKIRDITLSSVVFQEEFIKNRVEEESGKYEEVDTDGLLPKAVIPWHHRINEAEDLAPNRTILEAAVEESTVPIKPCIHTTKQFIRDTSNRTSLAELATAYDLDECFLLVEDLGKHSTFESTYKNVIDLVYDLSAAGVEPHFFYGDYFSNMLSYFGLGGTTYGVMYGEEYSESTERTEQSGMLNRYFVDQIKDFLKVPAAVEFMQRIDADMCECDVCQRSFEDWQDIIRHQESDEALMNHLQKHYVECRWRHARQVEEDSFSEAVGKLRSDFKDYVEDYSKARQISPNKDFQYMPRWINVLEDRAELAD
ncbi:uncharacterized protein HfgLR_01330 [Haloferax gibbonsii]|uniref:tRNA-guanine(15) transglycosylase-like domain-containing protein n=1 Tax=Haloferax gibbonsii TaxID=35746 RepID=A0A871BC92_HALGI|nr:hypothetical protein [Haloferax gibbonsii]QOS10419.1 uncharacterized protein HfgLR_01330 [Haloferax gibbonsii]